MLTEVKFKSKYVIFTTFLPPHPLIFVSVENGAFPTKGTISIDLFLLRIRFSFSCDQGYNETVRDLELFLHLFDPALSSPEIPRLIYSGDVTYPRNPRIIS